LRQAFNAREGITPDQIDLPKRIKEEALPVKAGAPPKVDFQALKEGFSRPWAGIFGPACPARKRSMTLDWQNW